MEARRRPVEAADVVDDAVGDDGGVAGPQVALAGVGPLDQLAVEHHHRGVGAAVVVEGRAVPGRPADDPHLVALVGEEADGVALGAVVTDAPGPQRLGPGQAAGDVEEEVGGEERRGRHLL